MIGIRKTLTFLQLGDGTVQSKSGLLAGMQWILKNFNSEQLTFDFCSVATLDHTIQTVASVGRIKWRPGRKNHIGSTSLVVDTSVCVWDVRRPFVPFAAFEKHKYDYFGTIICLIVELRN